MSRAMLLLFALAPACVKDRPFECETSADCARGGEAGVCEPTGFCSFVDASCGQAVRRYGDLADLGLGGSCVPCVAELAGGGSHLCARRQDGHLQCWGDNANGQIGDGSTTERVLPADVELDEDGEPIGSVLDIGLGSRHSCAVTENGTYCWGENTSGQLGDPSLAGHPAPTLLVGVDALSIAAGLSHTCWLGEGGAVDCIGDNAASQLGADQDAIPSTTDPVPALASGAAAVALGAGAFHTCAVMEDRSLRCWGGNDDGQVGDGSFDNARAPATVRPTGSTRAAATSDRFSCSVETGGAVLCWGDNTYGQLGNGGMEDREVPTQVALDREATQVALGDDHACARMASGELWCWGSNALGQLGPDAGAMETEPVRVRDGGVVLVAAAENTTCFLELSGTVLCMGAGSSGERGNGEEEDGAEPVEVGLSCDTVR